MISSQHSVTPSSGAPSSGAPSPEMKQLPYKRILSGVRPTGTIHLGNYLGAIKNWVQLQHQSTENFFCIVDQHALTTAEDSKNLTENSFLIAATYLSAGIDLAKSKIFMQSHVPQHTELAWYLSCVTPLGWLQRMTQFKDKAKQATQPLSGLLFYPVLMAADILAYEATIVPVGQDQKQHVELARDIAAAFNNFVNEQILITPEPLIYPETAKIMSLRDGQKKMSKSDESDYSRINLTDTNDQIRQKIQKAKSDSELITDDVEALKLRPEAYNLLSLMATFSNQSIEKTCSIYNAKGFGIIKPILIDTLIEQISPLREKINSLMNDKAYLRSILKDGALSAQIVTEQTLKRVRNSLNLIQ